VSADRLAQIKARAEAATPGPWEVVDGFTTDPLVMVDGAVVRVDVTSGEASVQDWRDGAFIASARTDVPWLVEQVERLERWKVEAIEVMTSLPELGTALGLPLGVQITGPAALAAVARLTAERDAFRKREECLSNEVEWWKERFPCDGMCSDAPEEDCSRHGRSPADLWRIISEVAAERDALAQIKRHIDEVRNGTGWTVQIYGVLLQQCDQYGKTIDTRRADKAEAERDALVTTVGRVQALVDSNPDHADTCGSVLTPGADYPCSCWQTDLRAALATTGEGQ